MWICNLLYGWQKALKNNAFSKVGYIQKSHIKYIRAIAPLCGESVIF